MPYALRQMRNTLTGNIQYRVDPETYLYALINYARNRRENINLKYNNHQN